MGGHMSKGTVNKVILIGRLGGDPELRHLPSGVAVATFSLATNRTAKDRDGNNQETTDWHRITVWRHTAEFANNYLRKGMRVYVEGRIQYRNWEDQNGVKHYATDIVAENLQILESAGNRSEEFNSSSAPSEIPQPPMEPDTDDEVPF